MATIDDYRWLVSGAAQPWLDRTSASVPGDLLRQAAGLRRELSASRAHLILETCELRRRARDKFARAADMFFTRRGLEQSTDQGVAAHKASRFAGRTSVVDLACGIGGDLTALAHQGAVLGIDSDQVVALLAGANLASCPQARVACRDAAAGDLAEAGAWHVDPDRRTGGRRSLRAELHSPSAGQIDAWRAQVPHAAVKLAPGATPPEPWAREAECEWISRGGECRQLVAWFGDLAQHAGRRAATVLGATARTLVGDPDQPVATAAGLGEFVFDPDPAVLAAHLLGTLAAEHALEAIDASAAYLTGNRAVLDPALSTFRVVDVLPLETRRLKSYVREHGIGVLEIKKRGVEVEPELLRRQLRLEGDSAATLLLARQAGRQVAVVAQRIVPAEPSPAAAARCLRLD
ncbi:MAG: hypothetical protein K1X74_12925 [Pirellulales bacterium]|nr:hypothetical protein [Pirellulales bacterium]